ncbi:1558_t:CDS:2 [Gigaspora margarita]|uniref:1558_t:CDS:1 n=1 Tax=Gigaspora margarita TaxID=4874 RepID=A0ABM8VWE7_GIGMA|nr:1558_t:CDS:2 [Gigaspora margarita]
MSISPIYLVSNPSILNNSRSRELYKKFMNNDCTCNISKFVLWRINACR